MARSFLPQSRWARATRLFSALIVAAFLVTMMPTALAAQHCDRGVSPIDCIASAVL